MGVGKMLDEIREYYLTRLHETAGSLTDNGKSVLLESAFRTKDGMLAREGPFDLPLRQDLMVVSGCLVVKSIPVDTNEMLSFQPLTFAWGENLEVRLHPFQWQFCPLVVSPAGPSHSWSPLLQWFIRWFDPEDSHEPDARGFHGVVHFLEDPTIDDHVGRFSVDFGTAPVEAFEELLDAIEQMRCTVASVGEV